MSRVVVTGVGLVTALGTGTEASWNGLVEGRSGVGPIEAYDASTLHATQAGEVRDLEPEQFAKRKALRSMTRNDVLALAGATLAIQDAGIEVTDADRTGLFVGSSKEISNPMHILEASLVARNDDGSVDIRRLGAEASSAFYPLFYVEGLQAAALFYVSQAHGLKGANAYFAGTAEAGAEAIGRAFRAVKRGECEWAVAGGYDDGSSWWNMTKFEALGVVSPGDCRPYDVARDGSVLGEGAAFVVVESEASARARGARVLCEIAGFGGAYDAHALIALNPEGRAPRLAIEAALREAGAQAVDAVIGHGSATRIGDVSEARAVKAALDGVALTSVKGATGHLVGAAGALNAAVAALSVAHGVIPPTLGCESVDPEIDVDVVQGASREGAVGAALAMARGFEGQNVALVFRRTDV